MTCGEAQILMADSWSENLDKVQELAFEEHLAGCETCRSESERLGALWKSLGVLPAEEPGAKLRARFLETLSAYRQGLEAAPRRGFREKFLSLWPKQPVWQMAASFALLALGVGVGYEIHPERREPADGSEIAQLRGEVNNMRQLVALSLMQQQSAGERLRGVNWAYRVEPSDTEVLSALLTAVNQDSNVNVRLAAVDALHAFGLSPVMRGAVLQAIPKQTEPLVQVALIDLLVDLKEAEAAPALRGLAVNPAVDAGVRQRANWALEKLR